MSHHRPIFLFSDFGYAGPYVGQMAGAILAVWPDATVVNLMHDAPVMQPRSGSYLLAACCRDLPADAIVVAVVDPGVGGERDALVVHAPGLTLVGPDNGLLSRVRGISRVERIDWRPARLSASFHGRDLFGPVAARLGVGAPVARTPMASQEITGADWPDDTSEIVYVDAYGNLMTGMCGENVNKNSLVRVSGQVIRYAETFCSVPPGQLFWYVNSQGLVEIAANATSAASLLSLAPGDKILLD